jgi:hypothetical protein
MTNIRKVALGSIVFAVVAAIAVSCGGGGGYGSGGGGGTATYSVGGNLSGATGTVVLQLNGGSNLSMGNGPFTFAGMIASGSTYNVQVVDANDRCAVTNGAGTMGAANITNVTVVCAAQAAQMVIRSARLDGPQAGTGATGTGLGGVVVNPTTRAITGGITFSGLSGAPTAAHIHRGDTNIAVGLQLASDNATGILLDNIALTPADYAELLAGTLYFNVHTAANPNGEIRGQINLQGGVVASAASLDAAQEVPSGTSTATGKGTVIMDAATRTLLVTYITHNVSNATMAHIHTSPSGAGSNGNVIVGFSTLQTNVDGAGTNLAYPPAGSPLPSANLTDFLANYLYFNVHSTNNLCAPAMDCGAGEIRGNIAVQ